MEGHNESLNLFLNHPINKGVIQSRIIEHLPITDISSGCIEFNVTSQNYIDFSKSTLYLKCKVFAGNNTDVKYIPDKQHLSDEGDFGLTNCLFSSLFKKVDLSLQHHPVSNELPNHMYAYKSYLDTILHAKSEADPSILFYKDSSKGIELNSVWSAEAGDKPNQQGNSGFQSRFNFANRGQDFEMESGVGLDFMKQKRLIPHNTNISLKFWQSDPQFHMMSIKKDQKFFVKILETKLKLCHVTLSPAVNVAISESLKLKPAQYPFSDSKIRTHTVSKGSQACIISDIFGEQCPNELFVCMINSDSFHGDYSKNSLAMYHNNLSEIGLYINNIALPRGPVKLNFGDSAHQSTYLQAYQRLLDINPDTIISFEDFYNGYSIFYFDLRNGENSEDLLTNSHLASTRLELRFSEALENSIVVLLYGKFNRTLQISSERNISISEQ